MPSARSRWPSSSPAGPAPTMHTWVLMAIRVLAPHGDVAEAEPFDLGTVVEVAQVDQQLLAQQLLRSLEIQRSEVVPFGYDDRRVGTFHRFVGIAAIGHVIEQLRSLLHAFRIAGTHRGP